jgi:PIN domain nuclease of toxin-antitoxin system
MRFLVDTHAFIWFTQGNQRLSPHARDLLEDMGNAALLSLATIWELAIKASLNKLQLTEPLEDLLERELPTFDSLPISVEHAIAVQALPHHHGDPFDRMLIAQAQVEGFPIMSADRAFDAYGVVRIWDAPDGTGAPAIPP